MSLAKNVFTIPSGTPFLRRLAQFVLDGSHISGQSRHDPLALSRTTIYLPTRRAVRSLRNEFSDIMGTRAAFLPVLRTLGDGDEMDPFLPTDGTSDPARVIDPLTREIQLARLVKRWVEMIGGQARELFKDEDIIIPSSSAESLWLAKEIGDLIDQMETEEISWESLENLVPKKDEYANWWQLTLDFLQIAMKSWPQHLSQIGACDPASHRRQLLDIRTSQLKQQSAGGPVIAAGSTGSIPATARFLKAVSELPQGAVILPGLDISLSQEAWNEISGTGSAASKDGARSGSGGHENGCEDHPQYGLSKLLETIGISRDEVIELGQPNTHLSNRSRLTGIALLPSAQTGGWRGLIGGFNDNDLEDATSDITIIEAAAERQEALAIALVLRKQIDTPKARAALVTPDRNLARRVAAELKRFDLNIDDSGGMALANTSNVVFLRLLISVATQPANSLTLASFVKHPFLSANPEIVDTALVGRFFEICLLRDVLEIPRPGEFTDAIAEFRNSAKDNRHVAPMIGKMSEGDWNSLVLLCQKLDHGFMPLTSSAATNNPQDLTRLFEDILSCVNSLTKSESGKSTLFSDDAGIELAALFEEIAGSSNSEFSCRRDELLSVFDALVAGKIVRTIGNTHPRISILGPLEARLQPLDCVILGGLNEGTWPARHDSGPFLNRPMKMAIELATPERRTGLSAHDFEQLLGCHQVFLTRSGRVDNAPTVPSRWLQRLTAVCGTNITRQMSNRGAEFLGLANLIDQPAAPSRRVERPCPRPPLQYRPNRLSVTEIETWIRDPYAIYAKRILNLVPLAAIGTISEPALRGTILHDAAAEFVQSGIDPFDADAVTAFVSIVENHMRANKVPDHMSALWMPRFHEVAQDFVGFEQKQRSKTIQSHCEISGKITVGDRGFELRGRADRIDMLDDGKVQIIDYKTGLRPTVAMARTLAPQLALEGAMVMAGGFAETGRASPSSLQYVRLRPRGEFRQSPVNNDKESAEELSCRMLDKLESLIIRYNNFEQGYISRFAVELAENFSGDYDHLARVREWSWGSNEADGGDDG